MARDLSLEKTAFRLSKQLDWMFTVCSRYRSY